ESGYYCAVPGSPCAPIPRCGDGVQSGGVACDDGGTCAGGTYAGQRCSKAADCPGSSRGGPAGGDGCSADCSSVETDYRCPTPGAACIYAPVACGDGILNGTEACDDGNTEEGVRSCQGGPEDGEACSTD